MAAVNNTRAPSVPTDDAPEFGEISNHGVVISDVEYWREGDLHVFRSVEFDLAAEHEDRNTAVAMFVENAEDLCILLGELITQRRATEDELELAGKLIPRFVEVYRSHDRHLREAGRRERLLNTLVGRSQPHSRAWHRSTRLRSSEPSPV